MKTPMTASLMIALLSVSVAASAAAHSKKTTASPNRARSARTASAARPSKKLSRDIRFNGSQVDGKYLSAGESVAEVEGDKEMGALVGVRKNFHDRLNMETARLERAQKTAKSGKGNRL